MPGSYSVALTIPPTAGLLRLTAVHDLVPTKPAAGAAVTNAISTAKLTTPGTPAPAVLQWSATAALAIHRLSDLRARLAGIRHEPTDDTARRGPADRCGEREHVSKVRVDDHGPRRDRDRLRRRLQRRA